MSFLNAASGNEHPIASKLFAITGVTALLLLGDFVTVTKRPKRDGRTLQRRWSKPWRAA